MTEALVQGLAGHPEIHFAHLNTQVSRTLGDKGKRQFQKMFLGLYHFVRFLRILLTFRPKVVYLTLTNSTSFNGVLRDASFILPARWLGSKVIIHLRGGVCRYTRYRGWRRKAVNNILRQVSLTLVQGERLVHIFDHLIPVERIAVLTNGIDDQMLPDARQRLGPRDNERRKVLYAGLLCAEKGVDDVLKAVPHVSLPNTQFVFLGEWASESERTQALAIIRELKIESRIDFLGVVTGPQKHDLFVSADVLVFPSYYSVEGHAVVTVEALAAGLPIVCTDHGALNESVIDGWNGFFVSKHDPVSIALRLQQVLSDDALRQEMGERSRALYHERFTLERFVSQWVDLVKSCVDDRSS